MSVIHKVPCKNCPSVIGTDPECEAVKLLPLDERAKTAFACGWRNSKFCKGYCDSMGISEKDLIDNDMVQTLKRIERPKIKFKLYSLKSD